MDFFSEGKAFCYMQPEMPQKELKEVAEFVGYEGALENVQLIELSSTKLLYVMPYKILTLITKDMAYFRYTWYETFTLKLYSDTEISFDKEKSDIFFNGQNLYHTSSEKTFPFLQNLISKLPASDKGLLSRFERIAVPRLYCRGQIPEEKLRNALAEYREAAQVPVDEDVIMLIDDTMMGKADNHVLITKDMLFINMYLTRPMQRRLYSNTKISYAPLKEKSHTYCLLINDIPVCSIFEESSAKLLVETLQEMQKENPASETSFMGIFEQIIDKEISVMPYISPKLISDAKKNFKLNLPDDSILVMLDDTMLGSFKNGIILTKDYLYVKKVTYETHSIRLSKETTVTLDAERQLLVNGSSIFKFDENSLCAETFVRGLQCMIETMDDSVQPQSPLEKKIAQIFHRTFYTAPTIPKDKLANAIAEFASEVKPEEVLALYDDSSMNNGKQGVLFTKDAMYTCTMSNPLSMFKNIGSKKLTSTIKRKVTVSFDDEIVCKGSELFVNNESVCCLIMEKKLLSQFAEILNLMKTGE